MKRVLLLILTILLSLNYALCNGFNFVDNGIYYSFTTLTDKGGEVQVETGLWAEVKEYSAIYCKTPTYVDSLYIPEYVEYQGLKFKVTSIGGAAFASCDIKYIELPNSLKSIGAHAFAECKLLKKIVIPSSVSEIGAWAFRALGITNIKIPDGVTTIGERTFDSCEQLSVVELPNGLLSIGDYAFYNCQSLKYFNIPNTVTSIGNYSLNKCISLKSIEIPNSVIDIGINPFMGCTAIEKVTIGCETINGYRLKFRDSHIKELVLTKDVKDTQHFLYNRSLSTLVALYSLNSTPPSVGYPQTVIGGCTIYVPKGAQNAYKKDKYWGKYNSIVEIDDKSNTEKNLEIIGKWKLIYSGKSSPVHTHVEYKSNGTFSYTSTKRQSYEEHGEYRIEGNTYYEKFSDEKEWYSNKIWLLNPMSFIAQEYDDDGTTLLNKTYTYQRVNPEPSKETNPLIYGKWEITGNNPFTATHVSYNTDGTFSYTSTKRQSYEEHGTFRIEGNMLYELYSDEDNWDMSRIDMLDSSNLTLMELKDDGITDSRQILFKKVDDYSGIDTINSNREIKSIYSIKGVNLKTLPKGLSVIRMSDGTVKKVLVK